MTCSLVDRFNPRGAPRPRLERVTEVLRLAKDLPIPELHDTDSVGRLPIIADDIFGNPKITVAKHTLNGEVLVGKQPPRRPNGDPATDALAGLRILQHGVVVVDLILSIVVTGLRSGPVPIQRGSGVLISHLAFHFVLRSRSSVEGILNPHTITAVPGGTYENQAVASVLSVMRSIGVPLGIAYPSKPNISSTLWRTVWDQKNKVLFFDSATSPNAFWVPLLGAPPVKKLTVAGSNVFAGNAASKFEPSEPF